MVKYELVNPCILGQFNSVYETGSSLDAAKQFWNDLTPHLTNNLPQIYITVKEQTGGELHHFKIKEKISEGSKMANFSIHAIHPKISQKTKVEFLKAIEVVKTAKMSQITNQLGGKKKRYESKKESSSSSSDSTNSDKSDKSDKSEMDSSDDDDDAYFNFSRYKRMSQPIVYWHYTPTLYRVTRFFTPTFNVPLTPYIHIWNPQI
jgi:hypothetical protein